METIKMLFDVMVVVVGLASLCNGFTRFKPFVDLIYWLEGKIYGCKNPKKGFIYLRDLVTCEDCLSFWVITIYSGNIMLGGLGYLASKIISNYIDGRFNKA